MTLGVFRPITVYPLYETATSAHWGQTPREALTESGELWSTYSGVAAENPNSWLKKRFPPDEITRPSPENRLIAWPYTKLMVANPTVNMGGAILMTSLAKARARRGSPRTAWSIRSAARRRKSRATICSATSSSKAIRRTPC